VNKAVLRKIYLQKRKQLNTAELDGFSQRIADQLKKLSFQQVHYLHLYYPIIGKGEVDTIKIVDWVRIAHPEIKLVLSKVSATDHTLSHLLWQEDTPLAMSSWGITEPEYGEAVPPEQLDMILIPLLIFDKKGNRIGYGKGFYDRFLMQCRPDAQKIGLSCFDPVDSILDVDQYDIPLDLCITPEKIWYF
jgi:5-formyltetrahydrofolate cyclo-ligase